MNLPKGSGQKRIRLSRSRVLERAMAVADAGGLGSLTMRSLAEELGVKPMALYHYFDNKEEILDGIVDLVFHEIELPLAGEDWRKEVRRRAMSAREELRRHTWAIALMESRTVPGPASLRHHEAMIATLRSAGFSAQMTAHAYALLDSYVYGFAVQDAALPFARPDTSAPILQRFSADEYPHLWELANEHVLRPDYDFGTEFEFGLDLIIDALARLLPGDASGTGDTTSE